MKGSKEKKTCWQLLWLIPVYQESHTSVSHVGGRGAAANNLPALKPRDHETANTIIDRNTKGGLGQSHPSCVKFRPNTAMCRGRWGRAGRGRRCRKAREPAPRSQFVCSFLYSPSSWFLILTHFQGDKTSRTPIVPVIAVSPINWTAPVLVRVHPCTLITGQPNNPSLGPERCCRHAVLVLYPHLA